MKMENTHGVFFMLLLLGSLQSLTATGSSDYEPAQHRGDIYEDSPSQAVGATGLGFSGIVQRHDGYVKGETPTIPKTSFTCSAQPFNPGLYADMETQCQVYHVCFGDRQESFLCGPGTNFNQKILACDFWYNFNCQESPTFYDANADIGKIPDPYRPTGEQSISRDRTRVTQRPVYPEYPGDDQRPIVADDRYDRPRPPAIPPPRVSVPPPPPRVSVPPPPRVPPPQPPRIQPEPPKIQTQPPIVSYPPPRIQPEPPKIQTQPPIVSYPPPRIHEPAQPSISVRPPPTKVRPPPAIQQQVHTDYDFEDTKSPSRPSIPSPSPPQRPYVPPPPPPPPQRPYVPPPPPPAQRPYVPPPPPPPPQRPYVPPPPPPQRPYVPPTSPPRTQQQKPVFPPVVSPPRISRPPLTPPVVGYPPVEPPRSRVPTRPQFPSVPDHPDANLKGSTGYRPQDPPRIPQPSRPVDTSYPSYPPPRPVAPKPVSRPSSPPFQQEHVEVDYVPLPPKQPPPPPQRPVQPEVIHTERVPPPPRRPPATVQTEYVPPPPPPPRRPSPPPVIVQQEVYVPPPPPPPPQKPNRPSGDYRPVLPPVSPSIVSVQQKPQGPPARPSIVVSARPQQPPQRPRPVFPPASDHPNANIKGGPGYQQPPPQVPRFEATRRPVTVPRQPPSDSSRTLTSRVKTPDPVVSTGYKPPTPQVTDRHDPPKIPTVSVPLPPPRPQTPISFPPSRPQTIDHPGANIKGGSAYEPPVVPQPPRIQSPTSSVGIKRPDPGVSYEVLKPSQPPSSSSGIKTSVKTTPSDSYKPPLPYPPSIPPTRIKVPSQPDIQQVRPQFPAPRPQEIDHPNANIKGGPGYQPPRPQPPRVAVISQPPSSPSTTSQRTKSPPRQDTSSGRGFQTTQKRPDYPKTDDVYPPAAEQHIYEPHRKPLSPAVPPPPRDPVSSVKQTTSIKTAQRGPPSSSHRVSVKTKQPQTDYNTGSNYKRGSETYPKPEFQQPSYPSGPYQPPIPTPPRSNDLSKKRPATQTTTSHDTRSQFPAYPVASVPQQTTQTRQPSGSHPAEYPYREVPGHQPPHQRQVFPHRDNPDHPNESLKGSGAYRPPPPVDFQPAASEIVQKEASPSDDSKQEQSKLGDTGTE